MLDELAGTAAYDASGNGNAGTIGGTLGASVGGLRGVTLNGSSQSITRDALTLTGLPVGSAARTLIGFVKPTSAQKGTVVAYGSSNNSGEHVILQAGDASNSYAFTDGVNAGNNLLWSSPIPLDVVTMLALTYAGGAGGTAILYRNGVAEVTTTLSLNTTALGGTARVRAGLRSDDSRSTTWFAGALAAVAIFPTALSATRIKAHYEAGIRAGAVMG